MKPKIPLYKLIIYFFIGNIIGTIYEELLCIFLIGKIESRRGVIFGPFNPVYGLGLVIIILFLSNIKKDRNKFLLGSIVGGLFEYFIWVFQTKVFLHESWNYTSFIYINNKQILNFLFWHGTSFFHAIFWGILSYLFIKFVFPFIEKCINKIEKSKLKYFSKIYLYFMIINLAISGLAIIFYNQRINNIENTSIISQFFKSYFNDEYIKLMFPNMTPIN